MGIRKTEKSELQKKSAFSAIVYFKQKRIFQNGKVIYTDWLPKELNNGENGRMFHSHKQDTRILSGKKITDHEFSLGKLQRMITVEFQGKYFNAKIIENFTDTDVIRFSHDRLTFYQDFQWRHFLNGDIVYPQCNVQQTVLP